MPTPATLTVENRPRFSGEEVSGLVGALYGLEGALEPLPAEWDQNFRLDAGERGAFVVKIANRGRGADLLDFENAVLRRLVESRSPVPGPRVVESLSGRPICEVTDAGGTPFLMRILTYLPGQPLATVPSRCERTLRRIGEAVGALDRCLAGFEHPAMDRDLRWDLRRAEWISAHTHRISGGRRRGMVERLLLQYRARIRPGLAGLPSSVIHNDANEDNLLLAQHPEGGWRVAGLLDFGDMLRSHTVNDLAIAGAYALLGQEDPVEALARVAAGYHAVRPLAGTEVHALFPLVCMRLAVSVTTSAIAAAEDPRNAYRRCTEERAWEALERLAPADWREAESRLRRECALPPRPAERIGRRGWTRGDLLQERRRRVGRSLSLAYEEPLLIVRGSGQFLFEAGGRAYLDCVNNVCHVGHCHPKVAAALSGQAAVLNTNTRYLHPSLIEYAERLTATLPEPLRVCFFVNSGSEANEVAVRMARTHTGLRDVIVVEGGYHGTTSTLVALSPYKCEGPGGEGLAAWAHKVVKPDPYRGPHRGAGEAAGRAYAEEVRAACERLGAEGRPPALFLCEPIMGCGGQIVPPEGYLRETYRHVRAAGGVCVADEVQVGFGRVGSHMWAFETQGVVPDIVTMGKPIGNGHPIGAVVTTPEIAASFANGMEFFSTFGGNPVSAAVGMAVLEVIEEERLQEKAERVGRYLRQGFRALSQRHTLIGDVRGLGLFVGVELVRDRATLEPATGETARLIEMAREDGVLLSAEGPFHNVLKIKPPMQFRETDADVLLGAVDRALASLRPGEQDRRAPTGGAARKR